MKKLFACMLVGAALVAGPAQADPPKEIKPTFRAERTYFHCASGNKVDSAIMATPTWDAKAPTQSVTAGGGCGQADPTGLTGTNQENLYDGVWKGYFTGNVKALTVEAHAIYVGAARAAGSFGAVARLSMDGQSVLAANTLVRVTPAKSSTGASESITFTVTGLDKLIALEDGDGDVEREFTLTLHAQYADQNPIVAWVYDTTEVPSGITFNPATNAGQVIAASGE